MLSLSMRARFDGAAPIQAREARAARRLVALNHSGTACEARLQTSRFAQLAAVQTAQERPAAEVQGLLS
jgi:hypothetical protein